MSIAIDEVEKKYPRDVALTATSENSTCRRTGYIAGRTAEPTEAEIEAGAEALCEYYEDDEPTDDRCKAALLVLYAAHEAVTA
jgi:hypothetical protein